MIYLKNKQTNEIKTFEVGNYLQLSKNIRNQYVEATQKEINAYLLQEAKNSKIAEIKAAKDEALYLPIDYLDTQFISSEKASQNILGALVLNGDDNQWLDINGNVLVLSRAELEQLGILIKTQRGMVYNNESTKITAINNATTIEEVNNITW
jgi:hypothetical protein